MTRLPAEHRDRQGPDAPASPLTRWVAALVLLFLVDAAQVLLLLPERTGELFAWPIRPSVNAAILGSAYVAGGYFFIRVLTGSPWRLVTGGFPPVIVFVWFAGAATLLHLDRLNDGGPALLAWVALYLVTPLLVPAIYLADRSRAGPAPTGRRLPSGTRLLLGASGAVVLALATIGFVLPEPVIEAWPWPLTPLTMRVGATVLALYGAVGATVALRGDAAGARIPLESQLIGLAIVVLAMLRGSAEIEWGNTARVFAAGIAALLAIGVAARIAAGEHVHLTERSRLAGLLALAAVGGAGVAVLVTALGSGNRKASGDPFSSRLGRVPTNRVTGDGRATLRLDGTLAAITVDSSRLLDTARHLMHIHAGARGSCPPASAARLHGGHRTISTLDGGPFYGKAVTSLTTSGDTSVRSFLAFHRFPATGTFHYTRTIRLTPAVAESIRRNNAVILVHGIDYNGNAVYDGGLDRSDLDRKHFGEATAPALCGALRPERGSAGRAYLATLGAPVGHRPGPPWAPRRR